MTKSTTAYIGLGSNTGDRESYIHQAVRLLSQNKDIRVTGVSDLVETPALGNVEQCHFINAAAEISTSLPAEAVHQVLLDTENRLGRVRAEKWAPRTMDLDLLLFGQQVINTAGLTVPHRQMHLRSFVLGPLCRLNAELIHPVLKVSVRQLSERLQGGDFVLNPGLPQLVCIAGLIGVGKTTLTNRLSEFFSSRALLEPYDQNPFMRRVYAGAKELALASQLYFLVHRTKQLNADALMSQRPVFSDYVFDKELIYARRLLDAEQLSLYESIYPDFAAKAARPVLVIYLSDEVEKCLQRIHVRNRSYEQGIGVEFLRQLDDDYRRLFETWKTCPVIRLCMSEFNVQRDEDIEHLAAQVKSYALL